MYIINESVDWMALAHSYNVGKKQASKIILSKIHKTLVPRIKNIDNYNEREGEFPVPTNSYAVICTLDLSHVLRYGGSNPLKKSHGYYPCIGKCLQSILY